MAHRPKGFPLLILGVSLFIAVWNEGFYAYRSYQLDKPATTFSGLLQAPAPAADPLWGPVPSAAVLRRTEESRIGMHYARGAASPRKTSSWGQPRQTISPAQSLTLGTHTVDARALAAVSHFEPVPPTQALADQIAKAAPGHRVSIEKDAFVLESTQPQDPDAEFIPAFRLRFEQIPLANYTIAGQLKNGVIIPVAATPGASENVVDDARKTATASHWALRFLAAVGAFCGIHILTKSRPR